MLSEIYGWLMMKTPPKKYKSDKNADKVVLRYNLL